MNTPTMPPDSILQKTYLALKAIIPMLERLPKSHKFTLGDRIQNQLSDILELMIEAYFASKNEKPPILRQVNTKLEKLRFFVRLTFELEHLSARQYEELVKRHDEIGRMTGGWLKSLQ